MESVSVVGNHRHSVRSCGAAPKLSIRKGIPMDAFDVRDLFGVEWKPSMLVKSDHMRHSDKRAFLLAQFFGEQDAVEPGLLLVGDGGEIESLASIGRPRALGGTLEAEATISRSFCGIALNGRMLGYIAPPAFTRTVAWREQLDELYICARIGADSAPHGEQEGLETDRSIESLVTPGIELAVLGKDALVRASRTAVLPLARMTVDKNGVLSPDDSYIPPVATLGVASQFSLSILSEIIHLLKDLKAITASALEAVGGLAARQIGVALATTSG